MSKKDRLLERLYELGGYISPQKLKSVGTDSITFWGDVAECNDTSILIMVNNSQVDYDTTDPSYQTQMQAEYLFGTILMRHLNITLSKVYKYVHGNRKVNEWIDMLHERGQIHSVTVDNKPRNEITTLHVPAQHVERVKQLLATEFDFVA